jgi:hypothetical protein
MVIFTRTYDFISWLIPCTDKFPRSQRFVVTKRLQDAALNFQECIIRANTLRGRPRLEHLRQADAALETVRLYLRLAYRWEWLSEGQYYHVSRQVREIGDLLGGWINQTMEACGLKPPLKTKPSSATEKANIGTSRPSEAQAA